MLAETLDDTRWDVLISGTGLQQSLLALALSRSDKRVLHIDRNDYYGGAEAALSLQEAQQWVERNKDPSLRPFRHASISVRPSDPSSDDLPTLSFSRAYSLALAPQIVYSRSTILKALVSSKVYRQLDFQAFGNWYIYKPIEVNQDPASEDGSRADGSQKGTGTLIKVPSGREDIFSADNIDLRAKRSLMNFLRFVGDFDNQTEIWIPHRSKPLPDFLIDQFRVPRELHEPLLALTLSSESPESTTTEYALPRIARHLHSIGALGPGFGAVIPKWGGLSEITQAACRAGAVGGTVYALGRTVKAVNQVASGSDNDATYCKITLDDGSMVQASWVVGAEEDLPPNSGILRGPKSSKSARTFSRSISIVASSLACLLPPVAESAPSPAGALIIFPAGSLVTANMGETVIKNALVHIIFHSSDSGECPDGQAILYACTSARGDQGFKLLEEAVERLLESAYQYPAPNVLWSMQYEQLLGDSDVPDDRIEHIESGDTDRVLLVPTASLDLALDDTILENVKNVWQEVVGDVPNNFMDFEDREGALFESDNEIS